MIYKSKFISGFYQVYIANSKEKIILVEMKIIE